MGIFFGHFDIYIYMCVCMYVCIYMCVYMYRYNEYIYIILYFFLLPYPATTTCQKRKQGVGIAKRACFVKSI